MPERDTQSGHSARLLRGLVWAGVVLAPIAAAVVLIGGDSSTVRFAVLLMAVSVVLIGASVLIRADPVLLRMDVEDRVAEEVEGLRKQLRTEFAAAVPAAPPVPEADPRPPLPVRNTGGRAQVAPKPAFVPPPGRPTFVHQPEPVVQHEPEPEYQYDESGYGYDDQTTGYQQDGYQDEYVQGGYQQGGYQQDGYVQDGYAQDGYQQDGYQQDGYADDGYQEETYQQPVRATGGRASVPGIVQPVSPAQSQGFPAQGTVSQGFPAQGMVSQGTVSQGFPAQGVPAGRATAAVPPPVPVARASAAAAVPSPPIGQPVPRPRAAASVPGAMPPGPNGMMAPPGPNGMMAPPQARAAAAVRPGVQYGRPESPDGDFGASNGYAGADDPETSADYKARRHRPSANDTNVGTLADFANYPGYDSGQQNW